MFSGEFELHLTGSEWQVDELAAFAERHQLKFSHIELHRGEVPSQPMLTISAKGTIDEVRAVAERWRDKLFEAELHLVRVKIEAAPWNEGVPRTDAGADPGLYFEHHVKVLMAGTWHDWYRRVLTAVDGHDAHVSRNARRKYDDGSEERFVTQRCFGVGRGTAKAKLEALLADLSEFEVLEVEEEYVVHDDALHIDNGWIHGEAGRSWDERLRQAPRWERGFPATFHPLAVKPGQDITQRAVFDPALKQFKHAFRGGDPRFGDPVDGARWLGTRRKAMAHVLHLIGNSDWAENLVLRGSVVMREWFGDAAREPGDLDFVVTPRYITIDSPRARQLIDDLVESVRADPGPGLRADEVSTEHIWTYERVPGRRVVFPFDVEGLPQGAIQIDLVFNEELPIAPEPVEVTGTILLAANQELSLAWKLQWLATDSYPQAKDLYDAALLAEHTTVDTGVVIELLRPELGDRAYDFDRKSVLELDHVDWDNAPSELPVTKADEPALLERIAAALR
ncbi:nucleotidyl transferase AbiEii/AbiGii toxin family protein [Lentzea sp. PSKA42]|uniref:Nucleotidyl transferase AbiEii/AbiGii toxin family protein n=1 Tax=Lentzea indica TaxID=2604800 RepID=A0ABX1FQE0_9PSEU|nr:nucleotidyl transferase AbiEii/AbiGii toxin family protein [Lentzea indica]NKE61172.1 nucleotidyl transferase AbiEii/AbiGii toxin family protein [Lentzea indica]